MGSAVERTDEHVREYLIYRGFTSTLRHLDNEIKADKEKGFRVCLYGSLCVQLLLFQLCFILFLFSFSSYFVFLLLPQHLLPSICHCYYNCEVKALSISQHYVILSKYLPWQKKFIGVENDEIIFGMFCLQVDKIIDQLQQFVQSFDLFGLKDYWLYLDRRLFSRLEDIYRTTVNKLRTSLYRYYVINTIQVTLFEECVAWNTATLRDSYSFSLFF